MQFGHEWHCVSLYGDWHCSTKEAVIYHSMNALFSDTKVDTHYKLSAHIISAATALYTAAHNMKEVS
jgi:hypothetical protein